MKFIRREQTLVSSFKPVTALYVNCTVEKFGGHFEFQTVDCYEYPATGNVIVR